MSEQISQTQALEMVKAAERDFVNRDLEAILAGYADDIVIRFADVPELHGKDEAERFLRARFARQKNYQLTKVLQMVQGNKVGNTWSGEYEDAQTGRRMRARGSEFWTIVDGKISIWDATFNVWDAETGPKPTVL